MGFLPQTLEISENNINSGNKSLIREKNPL